MNIVRGAVRAVTQTAETATAAAGAVSGAVVTGVIGGVRGSAAGVRDGISSGSRSTPAAALTLGVLGAAGLVDWPVLVVVGGTALVLRQFNQADRGQSAPKRSAPAVAPDDASVTPIARSVPRKKASPRTRTAPARKSVARTRRAPAKR